ncbi:MarR family winged helix-turn-helix transcriptional regulator [Desulfoscipio gibsoniae]|uniref:Transcriptional regulator n=1 Tax=Desulfoscipio gibsoniae DSM 7213 TaxID=767817 RepID=R4KKR4_9FIRM|nr:MarR family transcriptional regulator [Desulfoscipio gibsoniae]AGL03798.1 transcriptional regulator [Desulfoscipio gibsoniae DSM 7213]
MTTMTLDVFTRYCDRLDEMAQLFLRRLHQEIIVNLGNKITDKITGHQFMMMKIIGDRGRATVSNVADDLNVSLSAVTAQVDRLCKTGMVARSRSEKDRRVVWLTLTNAGQEVVDVCEDVRLRVMQRYLGHLDERDLLHIISIYEKIIALMRQEEECAIKPK